MQICPVLLIWVPGIEVKSPCFQSTEFSDWAYALFPYIPIQTAPQQKKMKFNLVKPRRASHREWNQSKKGGRERGNREWVCYRQQSWRDSISSLHSGSFFWNSNICSVPLCVVSMWFTFWWGMQLKIVLSHWLCTFKQFKQCWDCHCKTTGTLKMGVNAVSILTWLRHSGDRAVWLLWAWFPVSGTVWKDSEVWSYHWGCLQLELWALSCSCCMLWLCHHGL